MILEKLMRKLVAYGGSDLHLKAGRPPLMRILGGLYPTDLPCLNSAQIETIAHSIMPPQYLQILQEKRQVDFSFFLPDISRFRVNAYYQKDCVGIVLRVIPLEIPSIESLEIPEVVKEVALKKQGMALVTGPTGSGKSTTLAAMINAINHQRYGHIITIEDPIEFVYQDVCATINQRQLGTDTLSLAEALRGALRQDPDVILVGEMRDKATIEIALKAAETGHLVLSTLHTNDAKQTIDRIIDNFPHDEQSQIRHLLAFNLIAVISQRLLPRVDGTKLIAAIEIMINTPNIAEIIREGKTSELDKSIEKSRGYYKMQSMNQALVDLFQKGLIHEEDAIANSTSPSELQMMIKGISSQGYHK